MRRLGARVLAIHASPDGYNINSGCGSTHMDDLVAAVRERGADVGIAHDGDADRCLAVDAQGRVIDGDQIMAVLAVAMRDAGTLRDDTVVATVMSNLGFNLAMTDEGIRVVETGVGDRYVLEAMLANGYNLGGEQSGHVILSDYATTGDGVLTALSLLARMATTGQSLADLASVMTRLPQVLVNVAGVDRARLADASGVRAVVVDIERELGDTGRVLLRASGTEPLIRVMVEAPTAQVAQASADRIAEAVRAELAL
jgi:phosphoglucosamine mutase